MASFTSQVVPHFDFSEAHHYSLTERFRICIELARAQVEQNGYRLLMDFPCIPEVGAISEELRNIEGVLGVSLPSEYRQFLTTCRYLRIADGLEVGGLDCDGVYVTEHPWISEQHRADAKYLVFANYWRFADGDQLMFDMQEPGNPVIAYLHEHGPLFEFYAPSFSLALWRLLHETD